MDRIEQVKKLREEYERALDAAESRRSAYHEAVLELYQGGTPLREIAKELGLSHQRVHQIVSGEQPPRRSKLPRAAGGAAAMALILAGATFGALRLAHAPPFSQRAAAPPRVNLAFRAAFRGHGFIPGGAVLRRKREVIVRATSIGRFSVWVAPDRASRIGRCSWLQVGRTGLGGSCYQPPVRGIPELVPKLDAIGKLGPRGPQRGRGGGRPRQFVLIWGRTGPGVDRLTLVLHDGKHMSVPSRDGVFLIAGPRVQSLWRKGNGPSLLIARDAQGRVVDQRAVRLDLTLPY